MGAQLNRMALDGMIGTGMAKHYLSYWKPSTAEHQLDVPSPLQHAASEQYGKVRPGDTVWICTTWPGGVLTLLSRIVVRGVMSQEEAERHLGQELWPATFHILAEDSLAEPLRQVDCADIVKYFRFVSDRDRLTVTDGRVDAKQLQTMRQLTPGTADLLLARWNEEVEVVAAPDLVHQHTVALPYSADPARTKEVEAAGIRLVSAHLAGDGWRVRSVESMKVGYDLLCTNGDEELHVEVKATRADWPAFIITEAELRRAESDDRFALFVVCGALSDSHTLYRFDGASLLESFEFLALAHRAATASVEGVRAARVHMS
jgi:hypothetical protein